MLNGGFESIDDHSAAYREIRDERADFPEVPERSFQLSEVRTPRFPWHEVSYTGT